MTAIKIVQPLTVVAIDASGGDGVGNLLTRDPKEVFWIPEAQGTVTVTIDLGSANQFDTVYLGYVRPKASPPSWRIRCGIGNADEQMLQAIAPIPSAVAVGPPSQRTEGLWTGAIATARYLAIDIEPSSPIEAITAGVLVVGQAFVTTFGPEWGAGRQPIDTGAASALPSGGFAVVDGAHKSRFSWTFGDLSPRETQQLEGLALDLGETKPGLVIEQGSRPLYGLFDRWKAYERRNRAQTRWEVALTEWI